jgi:transcriptional regulator with GAF, ATPase, and Fis domain
VLQEFEFEPVGSTKTQHVDSRVILATNEDLSLAVQAGRFRQDLYYRINVINIELPPLRERLADIPLLAQHFLARTSEEAGKKSAAFTDDALAALQRYQWPGNVRELQNVVERAVLLGRTRRSAPRICPRTSRPQSITLPAAAAKLSDMEVPERAIILEVLEPITGTATPPPTPWGSIAPRFTKMKRLGLMDAPTRAVVVATRVHGSGFRVQESRD